MAIHVIESNCIGCGSCALLCPEEAIDVTPDFVIKIDSNRCTECLTCLDCCSCDALEGG